MPWHSPRSNKSIVDQLYEQHSEEEADEFLDNFR